MQITLKNFRCYENKTFNFEDGFTLVSGESGKGKTTIFMAILFALYNKGNKVVTFGKKSCSVKIVFDDITIVRSKSPNKLVVNDKHEDDVGQSIINKRFGNDTFESVIYLPQFPTESFILLTPTNKLQFLENFAFKDVDLKKLKQNLKTRTKQVETEMVENKSKLDVTTQVLREIKLEPVTGIEDIGCATVDELETEYQDTLMSLEKQELNLHAKQESIRKLSESLNRVTIYLSKLEMLNNNQQEREREINKRRKQLQDLEYKGDSYLNTIKNKLQIVTDNREYMRYSKKLEDKQRTLDVIKTKETGKLKTEMKHLEEKLLSDDEKQEILEQIEALSTIIGCMNEIDNLESQLCSVDSNHVHILEEQQQITKDEIETKSELCNKLELQGQLYVCPACDTELRFEDNVLSVCTDKIDVNRISDVKSLVEQIDGLKNKLDDLDYQIFTEKDKVKRNTEIEAKIDKQKAVLEEYEVVIEDGDDFTEDVNAYKSTLTEDNERISKIRAIKQKLDNGWISESCNTLQEEIITLQNKIESYTVMELPEEEEEYLKEEFMSQSNLQNQVILYKDQISRLTSLLHENNLDMENLQKKLDKETDSSVEIIKNKVEETNKEVKLIKFDIDNKNTRLKKIKEYITYKEEEIKHNKWKKQLEELQKQEKICNDKHIACLLLKKKIAEAESVVMLEIVKSLNKHTQFYLDIFFKETPMTINITSFKMVKKVKKPQIDILFYYKGMECQINMLSGGEMARVILAFTLALGDIFNNSLLLLDECTANLNETLTNEVFQCIKNHSNAKYILAIGHQVVKGEFDSIMNV